MAVSFVLVPFVVRRVGSEAYGLYVLVLTITGYFAVLDLGVTTALTKYVAEFRGRGDVAGIHRLVNVAVTYHAAVGVGVGVALIALSFWTDRLFHLGPAIRADADRLFYVAAATAPLVWGSTALRATLEAVQRYRFTAAVSAAGQLLAALAMAVALVFGAGVATLLLLSNLGTIGANVACYAALRRQHPGFRLVVPTRDWATMRTILGFSGYLFLGSLTSIVVFQIDNVVVGTFISVSAVAVYNIGYLLFAAVKTIDNLASTPPWVATAHMEGEGDFEGQRRLFLRGIRWVSAFMLPGIVVVMVFAEALITGWMGPEFRASAAPARILLAGWLVVALWQNGAGMVTAKGRVRTLTLISLMMGGLNLGLSLVLVRPWGLAGVAAGTSLSFVLVAPLMWREILATLDVRAGAFLWEILRSGSLPILTAAATGALVLLVLSPTALSLTLLAMLTAYALAVAVAYAVALTAEDRGMLQTLLRSARTGVGGA
jgi:O-antigen/teichoic acid export membrane protein